MNMKRFFGLIVLLLAPAVARAQDSGTWEMLDAIPPGILERWEMETHLVGTPSLAWNDRKVLTLAFNGGNDQVRALIEKTASEWTALNGTLEFSFRNKDGTFRTWTSSDDVPAAAVRIAFSLKKKDAGYWSVLGRMATVSYPNEQTMNLGKLETRLQAFGDGTSKEWMQSYDRAVILHEFGHALGLSHEHFHPDCQKDLKMKEIVAYLMGPPDNWEEIQARFNMDAAVYFKISKTRADKAFPKQDNLPTITRKIDQHSVMLYAFKDWYFTSGATSPCRSKEPLGYATSLSDGDKAGYINYYKPKSK